DRQGVGQRERRSDQPGPGPAPGVADPAAPVVAARRGVHVSPAAGDRRGGVRPTIWCSGSTATPPTWPASLIGKQTRSEVGPVRGQLRQSIRVTGRREASWERTRGVLNAAKTLLPDPSGPGVPEASDYIAHNELGLALDVLAEVGEDQQAPHQ